MIILSKYGRENNKWNNHKSSFTLSIHKRQHITIHKYGHKICRINVFTWIDRFATLHSIHKKSTRSTQGKQKMTPNNTHSHVLLSIRTHVPLNEYINYASIHVIYMIHDTWNWIQSPLWMHRIIEFKPYTISICKFQFSVKFFIEECPTAIVQIQTNHAHWSFLWF